MVCSLPPLGTLPPGMSMHDLLMGGLFPSSAGPSQCMIEETESSGAGSEAGSGADSDSDELDTLEEALGASDSESEASDGIEVCEELLAPASTPLPKGAKA